jgi:4-diphosphocytidyl-2-C-methyl-D-erythritol kinase
MARVVVLAPAKINLGLEILRKRPDGYHEIATILQALRLTDTVTLTLRPDPGIDLRVRPAGIDLGPPERNLAFRAAELVPALKGQPAGLAITLVKRIPVGAGMGGGSADAAAVLLGLGLIRRGGMPLERLEDLGASLGSDVPFFFRGGTQLATGRGERLQPAPPWTGRHLVVAHPNRSLSTASIYGRGKMGLTASGPLSTIRTRGFPCDFWSGDLSSIRNDLEPAVVAAEPLVATLLDELRRFGSEFVRVTGSGSAVFGVAPDARKAMEWVRRLEMRGFWAKSLRPARGGCGIRPDGGLRPDGGTGPGATGR